MISPATASASISAIAKQSRWRQILRTMVLNPGAFIGGLILLLFILSAIFAPFLTAYPWAATNVGPPLAPPSITHLFGTDLHGRDVFSRVVYGGRLSLSVGIATVVFAMIFGSLFGILIAYFGGWVDDYGVMVIDVMLGIPPLVLALLIVTVLGVGLVNVVIAVGIAEIPRFARVARGAALVIKARPFFEANHAVGASHVRIIFCHLLPNVLPIIIVLASLHLGGAIISAASLSFLSLGAQPPQPEWGAMLNESRPYMLHAPWVMIFPGLTLFLSVLSVNLLGDRLRDALDPRVSKK